MKNIAIFASGSGTNAENIIEYFSNKTIARVKLVLSNKRDSFVLERAARLNVPYQFFDRNDFYHSQKVIEHLRSHKIDFIVLAGFLWLVPDNILREYRGRIVNIHPALLPSYGGKGMYGDNVHKAVISSGDKESGISIHYVNESYDKGDIIFQARCTIDKDDTYETLAKKVHTLEYKYFPAVIEDLLRKLED